MITLAPIADNIQNTLREKISMQRKNSEGTMGDSNIWIPNFEIGSPITDGNKLSKNYMMSRVPFFRMISFTPKKTTTDEAVIIMGGQLDSQHRMRSGFDNRAVSVNEEISEEGELKYSGLYHQGGDIPYRPIAGVKDISVEYKGGGMRLGATREATINWTCWNWEDLTEFTPHFLQHGKTVLLEWGWMGDGVLKDVELFNLFNPDTLKFDMDKITNLNQNILSHIERQNGHYDAMLGLVQKWDWSVNESGGFECVTSLISPGVTLLQKHHKKFASSQMGTLPVLSTQTQKKIERWLWWDTDAEYRFTGKGKTVAQIAPYITFREYMRDFPDQVKSFIESKLPGLVGKVKEGVGVWSPAYDRKFGENLDKHTGTHGIGEKVVASERVSGWHEYKVERKGDTVSKSNTLPINTYSAWLDARQREYWNTKVIIKSTEEAEKLMGSKAEGGNLYVTWGWFEDNVLSRFFGNVAEGGKLIGEFRSIENRVEDNGLRLSYGSEENSTVYDKPVMQSTRMTNSKYLITVDASKWLIPNKGDPVIQNTTFWFHGKRGFLNALAADTTGQDETLRQATVSEGKLLGSEEDVKKYLLDINRATVDYMPMRNILFNAKYLKEQLQETTDLLSGVMSIWNEFSSIYGGVYRFKLDYDDDSNRMLLREEGYTHYKVKDLLESKKEMDRGDVPDGNISKLFVFPTWEAGSIVKSQNITAKLPDRMQLAAMYGVSDNKEKEDEKSDSSYDEVAARAWGRINQKPRKTGTVGAEERKRYRDLRTGAIDYPSRGNRAFGNTTANEQNEIHVEPLNKGQDSTTGGRDGVMKIYDSIMDEIEEQQKQELIKRQVAITGDDPTTDAADSMKRAELLGAKFRLVNSMGSTAIDDWAQLYNWNSLNIRRRGFFIGDDTGAKTGTWGYPKIKSEVLTIMQKLLRGGDDSILDHIDPLIPVDFEMEIDGTGGMFPGNSFHSSYVSKRYQEESLFQMVGVSHTVDSSGWFTTIKGQIRGVAKQEKSQNLTSGGNVSPDPIKNLNEDDVESIKAFQRATGLVDDGMIGPITRAMIDKHQKLEIDTAIKDHNAYPRKQTRPEGSGDESTMKPITLEIGSTPNLTRNILEVSGDHPVSLKQNKRVFGAGIRNADIGRTLVSVSSETGVTQGQLVEWNRDIIGVWVGPGEGIPGFEKGVTIIVGFEKSGKKVK